MENLPLISVIVPVYNVENWLKRCVDSISNQSYRNLEIILVNDGATDSSGELCDELALKDERIKVVHKPNGGLSDARNAGVQHATGTFISFIDSDDWIEKDFFANLYNLMKEHDCEIAGCSYRKCTDICEPVVWDKSWGCKIFNNVEAMSALIDNSVQQVVWNKLYLKSVIDGIDFAKGKYHEDEFWSYQVFTRVNKYVENDYVGYNYFQRADSIMGEKYSLKRLHVVEAKAERQKYLEMHMKELAPKGRVSVLFTCMYHGQLALKQLEQDECNKAISVLNDVINNLDLKTEDYNNLSMTHKVWAYLCKWSLKFTCTVRNFLKVGL